MKLDIKVLIAIIVIVAIISGTLVYFYFMQPQKPGGGETGVPSVSIKDLSKYSGKKVKISGRVKSLPLETTLAGNKYLKIEAADDTGSVIVYIAKTIYDKLLSEGKLPLPGDEVEATGLVKVEGSAVQLIVKEDGKVSVKPLSASPIEVESLSSDLTGKYVSITGTLTVIDDQPMPSYMRLYISSDGGQFIVLVPGLLKELGEDLDSLKDLYGHSVTVKGVVIELKGKLVIVLRTIDDVIDHGMGKISTLTISEFPEHIGEEVTVNVILGPIRYESGKYFVQIIDSTGIAEAVFDSDLFKEIYDPFTMGTGSNVSITGIISSASLIEATTIVQVELRPSPLLNVSTVLDNIEDIKGYTVVVKGVIRDLANRSGYAIFNIEDDTGSIKVFVPGSTRDALEHLELLNEGNEVVVAGYTDIYGGTPEIVLFSPNGLQPPDYNVPGEGLGIPELPKPGVPTGNKTITLSDLPYTTLGTSVIVEDVVYERIISYIKSDDVYVVEASDRSGYGYLAIPSEMFLELFDPWSVGNGTVMDVSGTVVSKSVAGEPTNVVLVSNITLKSIATPITVSVADISDQLIGYVVNVYRATITSSNIKYYITLYISDDSGAEIKVYIPSSVTDQLPADVKAMLVEGTEIDVAGYVQEYYGELEITIYSPAGIRVSGAGELVNITLDQLPGMETGAYVGVTVWFDALTYENHTYYISIHDDTGYGYATASRDIIVEAIDPWIVGTGSKLYIEGVVTDDPVHGKVIAVASITVLEPSSPWAPSISDIGFDDVGIIVNLYNVSIVDYRTAGSNIIIVVSDGTGNITVFIPASTASDLPSDVRDALDDIGRVISIAGYVEEYRGELEIVVYSPAGIVI